MRDIHSNRDNISTSNISRIMGAPSYFRGDQSTKMSINNRSQVRSNQPQKPEQVIEEEEDPMQVSQAMSVTVPYDYGFYSLIMNKSDRKLLDDERIIINDVKSSIFNQSAIKNSVKNSKKNQFSYKKLNLLSKMNQMEFNEKTGKEEKVGYSNKTLIYQFAREENDYKNYEVPNVNELQSRTQIVTLASRKSKKMEDLIEEIQQTGNSYVLRKQNYEISRGNTEHAHQLNFEYKKRKERFEINLIIKLLKKYENSNKQGSKIVLMNPYPYQELKRESVRLLDKYKKTKSHDKHFLNEIRMEATGVLVQFIKRIEQAVDDRPTKSNEIEVKIFKNYRIWKRKISELVNIWELFVSDGIDFKFPVKYLILKRFLSNRSNSRQNVTDISSSSTFERKDLIIKEIIAIFDGTGSKYVPRSILMPYHYSVKISEIITALILIYSLFSIPVIQFLGYQNDIIASLEAFVDVFFFIEIILNFRKVFRNKNNEYVYNLKEIMVNYVKSVFIIDFLSTIPWHFFFINDQILYNTVKSVIVCFKILRVVKLGEISERIEQTSIANYFRLFKLVFIFFFFAHWLGCVMYSSIELSLQFEEMLPDCYIDNLSKSKDNVRTICKYYFAVYHSAYIIPGSYNSEMTGSVTFAPTAEYITYIIEYLIGQILAAYIFGGMASVIQSLNQGQNIFINKKDMLNEHMMFYNVDGNTMSDVKIYFDYLWLRHKDVIYGKHHFDLLSKSLREKFERLNLCGNEILLAKFYNLNPGNTKLIGTILINLSKLVLFPFEILFDVGQVSRGIYVLLNGDLTLSNDKIQNIKTVEYFINYADVINAINAKNENKELIKATYYNESDSVIFPLVSAFIKTGRNWQKCFSRNFADLLFLTNEAFDELVFNFPIEMHLMKHNVMEYVHSKKLLENKELFKILSTHSSRSTGKYYQKEFDSISIWIPIPIPISQRKIASNYINNFVKKVRNSYREILLVSDLNMCLNSYGAVSLMKNQGYKEDKGGKSNMKDPIDQIRGLTKEIDRLTLKIVDRYDYYGEENDEEVDNRIEEMDEEMDDEYYNQ